jgi:hypothetical protein
VLAGTVPVLVHNCDDPYLDSEGLAYVESKHKPGGALADETKGLFNSDEDLEKLADDAADFDPTVQDNGNCARICTAGHTIGTDVETGLPTKTYTVISDRWGGVKTMHPGVPR